MDIRYNKGGGWRPLRLVRGLAVDQSCRWRGPPAAGSHPVLGPTGWPMGLVRAPHAGRGWYDGRHLVGSGAGQWYGRLHFSHVGPGNGVGGGVRALYTVDGS